MQRLYTDDAPASAAWPHGIAELNVLVQKGEPTHVRVMAIPKPKGDGCFDVLLPPSRRRGSEASPAEGAQPWPGARCIPAPNCADSMTACKNYSVPRLLKKLEPQLSQQASLLASVFGADWLRLDFFYGHPRRGSPRHPRRPRRPSPRRTRPGPVP